jgi:activator of 2-hydroxyglutaryl-CoA dehydratase
VVINSRTEIIAAELKSSGQQEIQRALEQAIDQVKTKQGQAKVILVGGGSIIVDKQIVGVGEVIRPKYLEVANAIGAAVSSLYNSSRIMLNKNNRSERSVVLWIP